MEQIAVGLKDAAGSVGLSIWTLRKWLREGRIAGVRLGRRVMIEPAELKRLVEQGRQQEDRQ